MDKKDHTGVVHWSGNLLTGYALVLLQLPQGWLALGCNTRYRAVRVHK